MRVVGQKAGDSADAGHDREETGPLPGRQDRRGIREVPEQAVEDLSRMVLTAPPDVAVRTGRVERGHHLLDRFGERSPHPVAGRQRQSAHPRRGAPAGGGGPREDPLLVLGFLGEHGGLFRIGRRFEKPAVLGRRARDGNEPVFLRVG